jgi:hypothetical protein
MKIACILTHRPKVEEYAVPKNSARTGQEVTTLITSVLSVRVTRMSKDALLLVKSFVDMTLTKLFVFVVITIKRKRKRDDG